MNVTMWKKILFTMFAVYVTAIYFLSSNHDMCISLSEYLGMKYYSARDFCYGFKFIPFLFSGSLVVIVLILWENNLKKFLMDLKLKQRLIESKNFLFLQLFFLLGAIGFKLLGEASKESVFEIVFALDVLYAIMFAFLMFISFLSDCIHGSPNKIIYYKNKRQNESDEIIVKVVQGLMELEEEIKKGMKVKEKVIHLSFTSKKIIIRHGLNYSIFVKSGRTTVLYFDGELRAIPVDKNADIDSLPFGFNIFMAYKAFSSGRGETLVKNYLLEKGESNATTK